ncbi:MAG TPA: YkgJ family cysteine cluster protein [Candidatus Binatia bacterium]|nr:YkgJ family cysteine cluster protein [Candidatus Binatia bacterium]
METCSCERCIGACRNDPGRLVPADLKKIAAFLKISESQLKADYLVHIPAAAKNGRVYFYAPAKLKAGRFLAAPGSIVPDYYESEKGRCIFLSEEGLCAIHPVKPFECAAYMGCRHTFLGRPYKKKDVENFFISRWRKF